MNERIKIIFWETHNTTKRKINFSFIIDGCDLAGGN